MPTSVVNRCLSNPHVPGLILPQCHGPWGNLSSNVFECEWLFTATDKQSSSKGSGASSLDGWTQTFQFSILKVTCWLFFLSKKLIFGVFNRFESYINSLEFISGRLEHHLTTKCRKIEVEKSLKIENRNVWLNRPSVIRNIVFLRGRTNSSWIF